MFDQSADRSAYLAGRVGGVGVGVRRVGVLVVSGRRLLAAALRVRGDVCIEGCGEGIGGDDLASDCLQCHGLCVGEAGGAAVPVSGSYEANGTHIPSSNRTFGGKRSGTRADTLECLA